MIFEDTQTARWSAPVEDILEEFYSAECLNDLYQNYLAPPGRDGFVTPRIKKSVAAAAVLDLGNSPVKFEAFLDRMPPALRQALQILTWTDHVGLVDLEKQLGVEVLHIVKRDPNDRSPRTYRDPGYNQDAVFELVVISQLRGYWSSSIISKSRCRVHLPPSLRKFFKKVMPPPAHYELVGLAEWPGQGDGTFFFNAEDTLAEDLVAIGDTFRRGKIKRNQNGMLAKTFFRDFSKMHAFRDFLSPPQGQSADLSQTRLSLLAEFFNRKGKPLLPPEDISAASMPGFLRKLADEICACGEFVIENLIPYVRPDFTSWKLKIEKASFGHLIELFTALPENGWVSAQNLLDYPKYRDQDLKFFPLRHYSARHVLERDKGKENYYYRNDRTNFSEENSDSLVFAPVIQGMAFFLATLGIVEIAYQTPDERSHWHHKDRKFLTPFDGLEAVRLTPTGAYAFKRSNTFKLKVADQTKCRIHAYPERLLIRVSDLDPITRKVLVEFMVELEPGFYRLESKRFLQGCNSPEAIRARVADFKRRLPVELPQFWIDYLEQLISRDLLLPEEGDYTIYSLAESPELQRLFVSNSELKKHAFRVEGHRIAIREHDLAAVRKILLKKGHYV